MAVEQRSRILGCALELMSERGAHGVSMRQLAAACELNVATLYHYFPSKAALLAAVLEDKRYLERLGEAVPEIDESAPPTDRLADLVVWFLRGVVEEEATWKLILGESLRGEEVALAAVSDLTAALSDTLAAWLLDCFPELEHDVTVVARTLRDEVLAFCVEHLTLEPHERERRMGERARDVATLVFPS